jgi:hypothetical protein
MIKILIEDHVIKLSLFENHTKVTASPKRQLLYLMRAPSGKFIFYTPWSIFLKYRIDQYRILVN